jgi:intein/homing endonuclease
MNSWNNLIGTSELARIVADITTDGHLQLKDWRGLTSFYSKDINAINDSNKRFKNLFGINGRIYIDTSYGRKRYKIFFISKPLAEFLVSVGVPKGNKTNAPFFVPNWIIKGNKKVKSSYLQGVFTAEGSIFPTKQKNDKIRWRIGIEFYKWTKYKKEGKEFLDQIREMILQFNIKCSPIRYGRTNFRKNGTKSIAIKLDIEKSSFRNFYKYITFDDSRKNSILKAVLNAECKSS